MASGIAEIEIVLTAYGGTVISWASRSLNPRPAVMDGVNSDKELNGTEMPKYTR